MAGKKNHWIIAINPGSTSTKVAIYENETERYRTNISHSTEEISQYGTINEQYSMRIGAILSYLKQIEFDTCLLSAAAGRGGGIPPVKSGAYRVNQRMLDRLAYRSYGHHPANLGAALAYEIAEPLGVPAFIYDSPAVDEFTEVARVSGIPEIPRRSLCHALNMRATAMRVAKDMGCSNNELNILVVHLGGGISMSIHEKGFMVDIIRDDEGPFSPERSGGIPAYDMADLCFREGTDRKSIMEKIRGKGGLVAYLGSNDALEVEAMIDAGDEYAKLVYSAMAYQVAKGIGELATVVKGKVDRIVITGGMAYSQVLVSMITERVEFIAPIEIMAGENELEALALGALRVIRGEESAREYDEAADNYGR